MWFTSSQLRVLKASFYFVFDSMGHKFAHDTTALMPSAKLWSEGSVIHHVRATRICTRYMNYELMNHLWNGPWASWRHLSSAQTARLFVQHVLRLGPQRTQKTGITVPGSNNTYFGKKQLSQKFFLSIQITQTIHCFVILICLVLVCWFVNSIK